ATGRAADGERAALRGIGLLTRLADEFPKEPRYRSLLASAEMSLGTLYLWSERMDQAEARYRRALELRQRLADADPADPEYQLGLAQCHFSLGDYYRLTFFLKASAAEFRRALLI